MPRAVPPQKRSRAKPLVAHLPRSRPVSFDLPLDTAPMEARSEEELPREKGWQFEPKWDGFRCLAFRKKDAVDLRAKSGKPLARYFPEVVALLRGLSVERFVVDGELTVELEGRLSFDALQMRLHPAESRIRKLAKETPARFVLFDMLSDSGRELAASPSADTKKSGARELRRKSECAGPARPFPFHEPSRTGATLAFRFGRERNGRGHRKTHGRSLSNAACAR